MPLMLVLADSLAVGGPAGMVAHWDERVFTRRAAASLFARTRVHWKAAVDVKLGWSIREAFRGRPRCSRTSPTRT